MPQAPRRIDYAEFPGGERFELNRRQQLDVEQIYGRAITEDTWEEIFQATSNYTIPESALQRAPTLEKIEGPLDNLLNAADQLREAISTKRDQLGDPLNVNALAERLPPASKGNLFSCYLFLLDWIISYTKRIKELHQSEYYIGPKGSGLWELWIIQLTGIMKRHGHRTGVSKNKPLPFEQLVWALQQQMICSKCKKYQQSDRSLSEAIIDARKSRAK